jgi:UDP-2-acetamido-3-amino-2,3-dideoxy-glucuronate N-acetyltransferase
MWHDAFVHSSSVVGENVKLGRGTKVWHFCHLMEGACLGDDCVVGQSCFLAAGVVLGNRVRVQNHVSIYDGVVVEDDVFLGPSCVLTNVKNPRAEVRRGGHYEKTLLRRGCTVGANATVVCGVTIGSYAFIGAGAVVTRNVPDYALVMGTPARHVAWVGRRGLRLSKPNEDGVMRCPESGEAYLLSDGRVQWYEMA